MQILVTGTAPGRSRVLQLSPLQLAATTLAVLVVLVLLSGLSYHFVFAKAAREGWPVVSQIVRFVVRDEFEQRDRFMRENLDAMARKVGELQARLMQLEAMGERVSDLAGVKPDELRPLRRAHGDGARGGPFVAPAVTPSLEHLRAQVQRLELAAGHRADVFTLIESRLFEARLARLLVPSSKPVDGPVGSGFGFRSDPFTGEPALHTGLDFPAEVGTPIMAAAGGMVVSAGEHPAYGQLVEVDHGNGLLTRYAHASRLLVRAGDLVRQGQRIAEVGSTGRSTGAHLHFEVLLDGVPQNPARFLAGRADAGARAAAARRAPGGRS